MPAALLLSPVASLANPWLPPGDSGLRHDIQLLADRGVLRGPVTSWPLSWPDIARDVLDEDRLEALVLEGSAEISLQRVRRVAQRVMRTREARMSVRAAGATRKSGLRTFSSTPRTRGELQAGIDWTGNRFAINLQTTVAADPDDGQDVRPDGSYIGANVGNITASAGYVDRWWGPGWEGSLILSTNARPVPALTLERNYSDAFRPSGLRWIGPWRASVVLGTLESERSDVDHARFLAMRFNFRPLPQLEIGLSRTAQWCGEGRSCDVGTLADLLLGRDNDQEPSEQPGNQLAGYDVRWAFRSVPLALYGQMIGEDEANGLPSRFLGLAGLETWGAGGSGHWRIHVEYADTSCSFARARPDFDCAYEHGVFTQGYRYRGRSVGHALDGDGRMLSLGVLLVDKRGNSWDGLIRDITINRDAQTPEPHPESSVAAKLWNLELSHTRYLAFGRLHVGIGLDDLRHPRGGRGASDTRGFVQWSREY